MWFNSILHISTNTHKLFDHEIECNRKYGEHEPQKQQQEQQQKIILLLYIRWKSRVLYTVHSLWESKIEQQQQN